MAKETNAVAAAARRAVIETSIERCRDTAAENIVEIGRWLNRAKEEGIVAHGEWTAWVAAHAGMNERQAQRAMQFARELPEGSPLARLGTAKITSLLALPAAEREEIAERIGAKDASSREVAAQVAAIRAERDEALRLIAAQKQKLKDAQKEKQTAVVDAIARTRADVTGEKEREMRRFESLAKSAEIGRKQTEVLLDDTREVLAAAKEHVRQLEQELERAKREAAQDPEQEARIALLEGQIRSRDEAIAQREREIDQLSDQLDEAKTAAMRERMGAGGEKAAAAERILSAIGAFTSGAGTAIGELERTAMTIEPQTRHLLIGQASLIGQMAMRVIAACGGDADGML